MLSSMLAGEPGAGVGLVGQHGGIGRHQQHVVEGEASSMKLHASGSVRLGRRRPGERVPWGTFRSRAACAGTRLGGDRARTAVGPLPWRVPIDPRARWRKRHCAAGMRRRFGSPAEAGRHHVELALSLRLAGGLACRTVAKSRFSRSSSSLLGAALEHLGDEAAAGRQHLDREVERRLGQAMMRRWSVGGVPGGVRRHVGQHQVGLAAQQPPAAACAHRRVGEIALQHRWRRQPDRPAAGRRPTTCAPRRRCTATWVQPPGAAPRSTTRRAAASAAGTGRRARSA